MVDMLTRPTPLPVPRPEWLPDSRIALERAREVTDAFSEGGWYTPSSEVTKPLYGLLIESSSFWWFVGILTIVGYTAYRFQRWKRTGL